MAYGAELNKQGLGMGGTPPGWYPDPDNEGKTRWWNGSAWADPPAPPGRGSNLPPSAKRPAADRTGPDLSPEGVAARAAAKKKVDPDTRNGCLGIIVFLATIAFALSTCSGGGGDSDSSPGSGRSSETRSDTAAFVMCQEFVKDRLQTPSTARFPLVREATIRSTGSNEWSVTSHVDAQNVFGAQVRTRWTCDIEYVGGDQWRGFVVLLD